MTNQFILCNDNISNMPKIGEKAPEFVAQSTNGIIHFPDDFGSFNKARKRLVFEELFSMQLALLSLKNKYEIKKTGIEFDKDV
ncbi:MAG: hypothetical protein II219_03380, partial [Alphaproteobacteria bacterium]|nr:hypothetical protein [Alphaproteobacteria bacterium]